MEDNNKQLLESLIQIASELGCTESWIRLGLIAK